MTTHPSDQTSLPHPQPDVTSEAPVAAPSPTRQKSVFTGKGWMALSVFLLLTLLLGWAASTSLHEQLRAQVLHLQAQLLRQPQLQQLAVLLDNQQRAAMLVSLDTEGKLLQLQRLNAVAEGPQDSMQLWALADGQAPRSLGVIANKNKTLQLPLENASDLAEVGALAISVEEKGGVPAAQGPRLPYLFQGDWVKKAL